MRTGTGWSGILAVLVLLGVAGTGEAAAQRTPPPEPKGEADALDAPPTPEEIREAMEQLMIVRMKKAVQLTPEQEGRVVPKMQQLLEARRQHAARRREGMGRLHRLVRDEGASDAAIGRALREVATLQQESRRREDDLRAAINSDLGPRQQARLMVFEARFRRLMQRRLQEAAGRRPGGPPEWGGMGRRGPGGPFPPGAPSGGQPWRGRPGGPPEPPVDDPDDPFGDDLEDDI
jgi:hypothetical protein